MVSAVPRDPMTWDAQGNEPQFFAYADQMTRDEAETFAERMSRWRLAEAYEAIEIGSRCAVHGPRHPVVLRH